MPTPPGPLSPLSPQDSSRLSILAASRDPGVLRTPSSSPVVQSPPRYPPPGAPTESAGARSRTDSLSHNLGKGTQTASTILNALSFAFLGVSKDEIKAANIGIGRGLALALGGAFTLASRVISVAVGAAMMLPAAAVCIAYKALDLIGFAFTLGRLDLRALIFEKHYKSDFGDLETINKFMSGGLAATLAGIPGMIGATITGAALERQENEDEDPSAVENRFERADELRNVVFEQNVAIGATAAASVAILIAVLVSSRY